MANDKKDWLGRAYAECKRLGHHSAGSPKFHNGACQEGYDLTNPVLALRKVPIHNEGEG